MDDTEHINGKAVTAVINGQPYYFGTVEDRRRARSLAEQHGADKNAFHQAMDAAGLQWGDTERLYSDDWSLEALTARQRALARYSIYRHSLVGNTTRYVKEPLEYTGLRFDEANALCEKLDAETWAASPDPERARTFFGRTTHGIQLERPVPQLWTRPVG
jgi:hypothetical protein